ncbi:hypothetical protein [Granulicoccus phenolivorans]|uniref:hypothetical protein n=1 Tax=Granulicoccus phenolivorans TaxID=266854 RepID=UPI000685B848|nr:hypothetical protein [Granulicoccus phenolivorans]
MQIAVRYERADPADHVSTCEVAARAVVALLASEDAQHGAWSEPIRIWRDAAIRKLVRRARPAPWLGVQHLPGVTVTQGKAAARAFVPAPVRPLPPELAKLQVEGTELPRTGPSSTVGAYLLIALNPHIEMTTGKAAAQCGHAAQLSWEAMTPQQRATWAADAYRVRVTTATPAHWARQPGQIHVVDAGFTELDGPTETVRAWWPPAHWPDWKQA